MPAASSNSGIAAKANTGPPKGYVEYKLGYLNLPPPASLPPEADPFSLPMSMPTNVETQITAGESHSSLDGSRRLPMDFGGTVTDLSNGNARTRLPSSNSILTALAAIDPIVDQGLPPDPPFTQKELDELQTFVEATIELQKKYGGDYWNLLRDIYLPKRTPEQIRIAYWKKTHDDASGLTKRETDWTASEDHILTQMFNDGHAIINGNIDWTLISTVLHRSLESCENRWNYLHAPRAEMTGSALGATVMDEDPFWQTEIESQKLFAGLNPRDLGDAYQDTNIEHKSVSNPREMAESPVSKFDDIANLFALPQPSQTELHTQGQQPQLVCVKPMHTPHDIKAASRSAPAPGGMHTHGKPFIPEDQAPAKKKRKVVSNELVICVCGQRYASAANMQRHLKNSCPGASSSTGSTGDNSQASARQSADSI